MAAALNANSNNGEATFSMPPSPLLQYLHQHSPLLMSTVQSIMQDIVKRQGNYDPNNATMILCDEKIERALNVKSCHIGQLKEILHKRLGLPMQVSPRSFVPEAPRTAHRRYPLRASPYRAVVRNQNIHAASKLILRPKFAELLNSMEGAHRNRIVFQWGETCELVSRYIAEHQDRIMDPRNPSILNLRDDPMGSVFRVLALHRNQIAGFIREQIIPYDDDADANANVYVP